MQSFFVTFSACVATCSCSQCDSIDESTMLQVQLSRNKDREHALAQQAQQSKVVHGLSSHAYTAVTGHDELCLPLYWDMKGYNLEQATSLWANSEGECASFCASNLHKQGYNSCDEPVQNSQSEFCSESGDCKFFSFSPLQEDDLPAGYVGGHNFVSGNCVLIPDSENPFEHCGHDWAIGRAPQDELEVLDSFSTYELVEPSYTQTSGKCRGGPNWPGRNQVMYCVKGDDGNRVVITQDACEQLCNDNENCGAYGRHDQELSTCCLFQEGNTGNGDGGRFCFVAAR